MRVYLLGGAEERLNQMKEFCELIDFILIKESPSQVLHIPFGKPMNIRNEIDVWRKWFFDKKKENKGLYLSAESDADIRKSINPLIFISGGSNHAKLVLDIIKDERLLQLLESTNCIIGDCSGAMILGQKLRSNNLNKPLQKGLGLLKNLIVEPHFDTRERFDLICHEMINGNVRFGLGIDSLSGVVVDPNCFPESITKIGQGEVKLFRLLDNDSQVEYTSIS